MKDITEKIIYNKLKSSGLSGEDLDFIYRKVLAVYRKNKEVKND